MRKKNERIWLRIVLVMCVAVLLAIFGVPVSQACPCASAPSGGTFYALPLATVPVAVPTATYAPPEQQTPPAADTATEEVTHDTSTCYSAASQSSCTQSYVLRQQAVPLNYMLVQNGLVMHAPHAQRQFAPLKNARANAAARRAARQATRHAAKQAAQQAARQANAMHATY